MEKDAAVLMADLSGYTAMTNVHGGASAAFLVKKYMAIVNQSLTGSTKLIQRVGDQIVLLANDANDILETAITLNQFIRREHHFLSIHAGIHYGSVFIEDGNLFGSTINLASRIMNIAEPGQVLCSSDLFDHVNHQEFSLNYKGEFSFKNVLNKVLVYELQFDLPEHHPVDPVCRMQVDPTITEHTHQYQSRTYHFCGEQCKLLFEENPNAFL